MAYNSVRDKLLSRKAKLDNKVHEFDVKCHKIGLKMTFQRSAIYETLLELKNHPSAQMVLRKVREKIPNISMDTVNRTLTTLCQMGVAFAVEGSGNPRRFDANMENHQHFKCIKCKRIIDFQHKPFEDIKVPAILGNQITVLRKTVYFEGLCEKCGKRKSKNRNCCPKDS